MIDKLIGLVAAKDPLAFQAIQASNYISTPTEVLDPSDEGEAERILKRDGSYRSVEQTNVFANEPSYDSWDDPSLINAELFGR